MTATASFKNFRIVSIKAEQHFLQLFVVVTLTLSGCVTDANSGIVGAHVRIVAFLSPCSLCPVCLPVCLSVCLCVCQSVCLSVCVSVSLHVCLLLKQSSHTTCGIRYQPVSLFVCFTPFVLELFLYYQEAMY